MPPPPAVVKSDVELDAEEGHEETSEHATSGIVTLDGQEVYMAI